MISIHAPAKGATKKTAKKLKRRLFQSTLPRRERPVVASLPDLYNYFNPRSREGSDYGWEVSTVKEYISIHAPAKGATVEDVQDLKQSIISIHAPAKGATST